MCLSLRQLLPRVYDELRKVSSNNVAQVPAKLEEFPGRVALFHRTTMNVESFFRQLEHVFSHCMVESQNAEKTPCPATLI